MILKYSHYIYLPNFGILVQFTLQTRSHIMNYYLDVNCYEAFFLLIMGKICEVSKSS